MELSSKASFPSPQIIERIELLRVVNATPTQFKDRSTYEIARTIIEELGGQITIDFSKAPESERKPIIDAANVEIEGKKPIITILGDDPNAQEISEEDQVLRDINAEILNDSDQAKLIQKAFNEFIQTLIEDPQNYQLVRDEWNKYIVGHDKTGKIDNPLESHHLPNVGLKRKSEGEDPLREKVLAYIIGIMEEFRDQLSILFRNTDIIPHQNPEMNNLDSRILALGLAEWSNFVRGAIYYRHRRGEKSLQEYPPRALAAKIIDKNTIDKNALNADNIEL